MPEPLIEAQPLRSLLYMPASNARAVDKARALPCDAVALDLEDAVAPDMKDEARSALVQALTAGGFGHRQMIARINPLGSPWGKADLATLAPCPLHAILAPKVNAAADVVALSVAMDGAGFDPAVGLWVMIETPQAVLALERIAETARISRLAGFVLGLNDLAKETGMAQRPGRAGFVPVMVQALMAARAYGLVLLDGVCNAIDDPARLEAECFQAQELGLDGKTLIHPSQIEIANRVFAPDEAEVAEAAAIVAAFADPANAGKGALKVGGKMAELLHHDMAVRLLAKAAAIATR
ncbi:HpcH/HpaI aldolase/citrate lyase family protein [Novosphingobium fuchskuhlense]|uniref:HpcH/HpaI aldolase/citrate lyase family protein n=1 Tax=Novosphingobium fuchskuhlense TaxID=1117702 RepID=UPI000AD90347|nr:CoA ester lyase [Novosphingobium fuchskuhlense]